jgi:hypothetical protein
MSDGAFRAVVPAASASRDALGDLLLYPVSCPITSSVAKRGATP